MKRSKKRVSRLRGSTGDTAQYSHNPKQKNRTNNGGDKTSDDADGTYAKQSEQPTAKNTSDYSNYQIYNQTKAASTHQFSCDETG